MHVDDVFLGLSCTDVTQGDLAHLFPSTQHQGRIIAQPESSSGSRYDFIPLIFQSAPGNAGTKFPFGTFTLLRNHR